MPKTAAEPTKVSREDLVNRLNAVRPGLSTRDIVEQSTSFVFQDGTVTTFNEDLFCRCPSGLPKALTGAVQAKTMSDILAKMDDEFLEIDTTDPRLLVLRAGPRTVELAMDPDIRLPVKQVDTPKTWKPLPADFLDALLLIHACAGRDEDKFVLTCVHLTPDFLEASDTSQIARYQVKSPLDKPVLARRKAVAPLVVMDLTEVGQTDKWLHLRDKDGLHCAVQNYAGEYKYPTEKISSFLKGSGAPIDLPKSLVQALDRAAVASAENPDADLVHLQLVPGKGIVIKGVGETMRYTERKKVGYTGPKLAFAVSPKLMQQIVKEHTACQITAGKLMVDGDRFRYCAALEDIPPPVPANKEE